MSNVYEQIKTRLDADFVKSERVARILALAIASGQNVLLWGPAGHGKSEMVMAGLSEVADEDEIFVQSFGEGMDEATLWGGLDFRALEDEKELRYYPENSFLSKGYGVFEEIFDAPSSVLLALKDTLTAKKLRKGAQQFAMKTKVVIAITNKDPQEISDLGPAAHALIERFPLQYKVEWPSYTASDYGELIAKVTPGLSGPELNGQGKILAELLAKVGESGEIISPRSAVKSVAVIKAAAEVRGSAMVEKVDLVDLVFLPGFESLADGIRGELDAAAERAEAEVRVAEVEAEFKALEVALSEAAGSPIKLLQVAKRFTAFGDKVAQLRVTDGLTDRRKRLREASSEKSIAAQKAALEETRI